MKKIIILISLLLLILSSPFLCQLYFNQFETRYSAIIYLAEEQIEKLNNTEEQKGFWAGFYQNGKIPYYSHYKDWLVNKERAAIYERVQNGTGSELDRDLVKLYQELKQNDIIFKNPNEHNYQNGKIFRLLLEVLVIFLIIVSIIKEVKNLKKKTKTK
ncbi:hypothetical protein PG291_02260 [Riemerella anatipestifer]|nr:hypothetical protein [Riemerella anatipestifer]